MKKRKSTPRFKHFSRQGLLLKVFSIILMAGITAPGVMAQAGNPAQPKANASGKSDAEIEKKLVQLALEGPQYKLSEHQIKLAEYQVKTTRRSWLNLLSISANYNDQTFAKQSAQSAYVYPKFFFGINIPLGLIFSKGTEIKVANESVAISRLNQEQSARVIKAEVLSKYRQYRNYSTLIAMQSEVNNDEQAAFLQTEKKFREGSISMETFSVASKGHIMEIANELNLQLQQDLLRIDIEKIIGVSLDSVIK